MLKAVTVVVLIVVFSITLSLLPAPDNFPERDVTNPYGAKNETGFVEDYYVVAVYDTDGVLRCSYPITLHLSDQEEQNLGCSGHQEGRVFTEEGYISLDE